MCRTTNWGGFCIFVLTMLLLFFGMIVINKVCILYWFYEPNEQFRIISLIPCTSIGTILFIIFNSLGYLATVCHLRASFCDPGVITHDIQPPPDMKPEEIKRCKR